MCQVVVCSLGVHVQMNSCWRRRGRGRRVAFGQFPSLIVVMDGMGRGRRRHEHVMNAGQHQTDHQINVRFLF